MNAWRTGNSDALEHLFSKGLGQDSALQQRMVTDRNLDWLPRIEDLLTGKKNAVVVVGTGHLVGQQGMIALLRRRGWEVKQQ